MAAEILIVDDEPDVELLLRQRYRRELRDGTYTFHFARNGAEALAIFQANPAIELVLSDINMPVMDGLTLLARLHEFEPCPGMVVVSAYGDLPNIRAAMNRGAFDFLTKPIDFQDFEVTIRKTVEQVRRLREAAADRDRLLALDHDLRTATEIQRSFLPPSPAPFNGRTDFHVHAAMVPARAVGGDFFDYFLVRPDDRGAERLGVVVGDVSGKGIPAALLMAVSRSLLRAAALQGATPAECLAQVNRQLLRDAPSSLFVTVFCASLDPHSGELLYVNAGHLPPLLLRANGTIEALPGRGMMIGAFDCPNLEPRQAHLCPGDLLLVYSDGVTDALDLSGKELGDERLHEVLRQHGPAGPEELVKEVVAAVRTFAGEAAQFDDVTALALRYDGEQKS
jgi:phosphoserine phosphatase RsbU/P